MPDIEHPMIREIQRIGYSSQEYLEYEREVEKMEGRYIKEAKQGFLSKRDTAIYCELRENGVAEVGALEAVNSFTADEMNTIRRFVKCYIHYFEGR